MQPQEIFDTVVRHLAKQGKPARRGASCVYRAPDGGKCAVGVLIPDYMYDPKMDTFAVPGTSIRSLVDRGFALPAFFADNIRLLQRLQGAHDRWEVDRPMKLALDLVNAADEFDLDTSAVVEAFPAHSTARAA